MAEITLEEAPRKAREHFDKGFVAFERGNLDYAMDMFESALEADFVWMYDDGPGSANVDCTSSDPSGCWGHRHDILWQFSPPVAMGAGVSGASMTELFVGRDACKGVAVALVLP